MTIQYLAFAVMALIWGLTWIAIKTGVSAVPPFAFAGARLIAAGTILLCLAHLRRSELTMRGSGGRVVSAAILVNTVAYGLLFWGMQYVPSGLSSVINLALIPVGLFTVGLAAREETFSQRKMIAIMVGVFGLVVLFLPKLRLDGDGLALAGMVALVVGTLSYCCGSIVSRPLLRGLAPMTVSGWLTFVGGIGLGLLSVAFEPWERATLSAFLTAPVLGSWLFLVLGGSVVAFTLFLRLLHDWGPARAGLYAFVSPVIAVVLGVYVFGEPFGAYEIAGSSLLLAAAGLALRPDR